MQPDEGVDPVAGDEGRGRRQRPAQLDRGRVEADLLLGLAQRRRAEVGVARVAAPAGKGDLAGVAAQVGAALGEDQARLLGPAVERQQHRRVVTGARRASSALWSGVDAALRQSGSIVK